jgi:hypothetical protein
MGGTPHINDGNDDIRGIVDNLGLPPLEVGTLYYMMGMDTPYKYYFDGTAPGPTFDAQKMTSRVLRWGRFLINGRTALGLDEWQKGWDGTETDLWQNVETPALARQTFRATYNLSFLPNPTDERVWMAAIVLIALVGSGLIHLLYRRKPA